MGAFTVGLWPFMEQDVIGRALLFRQPW